MTIKTTYDTKIKYVIILTIFTGITVAIQGYNLGSIYYFGFVLLIPLLVSYYILKNKIKRYMITAEWGKHPNKKQYYDSLDIFYRYVHPDPSDDIIDDTTWSDLNMDKIYAEIDRTYTAQGEYALYDILKSPLTDASLLNERLRKIKYFENNQKHRETILFELLKLKNKDIYNSAEILWGELPKKVKSRYFFDIMYLLAVCSLLSIFLFGKAALLAVIAVFLINSYIYYHLKSTYSNIVPAVKYLSKIIKTADRIRKKSPKNFEYRDKLAKLIKTTKPLYKKIRFLKPPLFFETAESFFELVNMYFLRELRGFYNASEKINKSRESLKELYCTIGEIDAMISIGSFKAGCVNYCRAEFIDSPDPDYYIKAVDAYHPLLEKPVSNSFIFTKTGIIITGSNMAGKSTFLRTVGINVLLAQTLGICFAKQFELPFMKIITSINKSDDLTGGKSFYFNESDRLLKIINTAGGQGLCLCIIDELLAGTNSFERLKASEAILRYLTKKNTITLAATHDITLATDMEEMYECYHFIDTVDDSGMNFDYKMKHGISITTNAIRMLDYMGYPKEIINEALKDR